MTVKYYLYDGGYFERDIATLPPGAIQTTQRPAIYYTWNGSTWVFDSTMAKAYWKPIIDPEIRRTDKFMFADQETSVVQSALTYRNILKSLENSPSAGQVMPSVPTELQDDTYYSTPTANYNLFPGGQVVNAVYPAGNYTVLRTDYFIGVDTTSTRTITLPTNALNNQIFCIKDISGQAATNPITIQGNGKTIEGASSFLVSTNFSSVFLIQKDSTWLISGAYNYPTATARTFVSPTVSLTATGPQNICITPIGFRFYPSSLIFELTTVAGLVTPPTLSLGIIGSLTSILGATLLTGVSSVNNILRFNLGTTAISSIAGNTQVAINTTIGAVATSYTGRFILQGICL